MASFNGDIGTPSKGFNLKVEYTLTQSINGNYTDISATGYVKRNKSSYYPYNSTSDAVLTIDGNANTTHPSYNLNSDGYKSVITHSKRVNHNADGTKSVTISFKFDGKLSSYYPNGTISETITLPTIPRASSITVNDANIGSATNIVINKASSGFTTTLYYKTTGQSSYTKIVDKTSNQVYGWTVPTSFYSLIPNAKTLKVQFYADTYSGNTLIGTSSVVTATFTATGNPTINSVTLVDTNSATTALTGDSSKMIRYASNVRATVSASARNSASISSIKVNNVTASSGVVNFNGAGTNSYYVVVVDSRGYSVNQTKTMTMVDYVPLTLNYSITRNQPTDGKVKLSYNGNYFNGNFGATTNSLTVQYRYVEKGQSWDNVNWIDLTPAISGNTYSETDLIIENFDYQKQFEFQIRAIDKIQTKTVTGISVPKGEPIFWWNDDGLYVKGLLQKNGFNVLTEQNVIFYNSLKEIDSSFNWSTVTVNQIYTAMANNSLAFLTFDATAQVKTELGIANGGVFMIYKNYSWRGLALLSVYGATRDFRIGVVDGQNNLIFKQNVETVLYNNTTGTNGNVTLSESAANFDYIEIFYRSNDTAFNSVKVYSPNNKVATLIAGWSDGNNLYTYIKHKTVTISGTTISINDSRYTESRIGNNINTTTTKSNNIYITRVVGYK